MTSTTDGDVLIAGLNDAHKTGVTLDNVRVEDISPSQVHGHFRNGDSGAGRDQYRFLLQRNRY